MDNKEKILATLFESDRALHTRLLARKMDLSPNTVMNLTKELEKEGLVQRVKDETNKVTIQPVKNTTFTRKKTVYNVEKLHQSGLITYLQQEYAYPTIILFGSYAKGENHSNSDIDLFILADEKKLVKLDNFEKKLNAPIQLFVHTKQEFNELKKKNKELVNNILNGIILEGYIEVV